MGDQSLDAGANNMATPIASTGASAMNTALYQRRFVKHTAPNIHRPWLALRGHIERVTGFPFMIRPTMRCKSSCTNVPGNKTIARIAG